MGPAKHRTQSESGFSLIEVLIAAVLVGIAMMGLAFSFTSGFAVVMTAQEDTIARQKAREALESVLTGRNTQNITFDQIDNVGTGIGIFQTGFKSLYQSGADGIIDTADDLAAGIETITLPGPDQVLGTADDVVQPLTNFQRKIEIADLTGILKQMRITIQYTTPPGLTRSVVVTSYVSPYVQ